MKSYESAAGPQNPTHYLQSNASEITVCVQLNSVATGPRMQESPEIMYLHAAIIMVSVDGPLPHTHGKVLKYQAV